MHEHADSRRQWRDAALWTVIFSLLAHGYRYLSASFSGDSMLLSLTSEEAYQASLGRFMQPVYWQIRGYINAPFLIGMFSTCFLWLSALLIIRLLSLSKPIHIAFVCGILTANETMAISNATYLPWTDVYALALLLSLLGVYAFFRCRLGLLLSPILYCLSLGLYQSYLPAASTMLILLFLMEALDGKQPGKIWKRGLLSCATLLCGLVLYAIILWAVLSITGGQASQDYNGVGRVGLVPLSEIPTLLCNTFLTPLRLLFTNETVMTWHITTVPPLLNIALFALTGILLVLRLRALRPLSLITVAFLLLVLPLGMNFIEFVSKGISSGLTIYAYNLLYLLPVVLWAQAERCGISLQIIRRAIGSGVCLLLGVFLALNIRTSNAMALKRDLEFSATTSAVSRMLDQAERLEGYIPGETPVVLIGMLPSSRIAMERTGFEKIAQAQGMRYTYASSYETANYWHLQMALGERVNLVSHSERQRLSYTDEAIALPLYPQDGYCAMINGYLYIRIS